MIEIRHVFSSEVVHKGELGTLQYRYRLPPPDEDCWSEWQTVPRVVLERPEK